MVRVTVSDEGITITPVENQALTLEQRLALFDPARHGGEAMVVAPLGAENG
jgi:antitoxin MazE